MENLGNNSGRALHQQLVGCPTTKDVCEAQHIH
jgi:hypothetical protein